MNKTAAFLALLAVTGASIHGRAAAAPCTGIVVVNDSAEAERGGEPLAGAKVSDGVQVVTTGEDGRYALDAADGRAVFLVKPAGYWLATGRSAWKLPGECGDFAVGHPDGNLHWSGGSPVIVMADPQLKSPADADYFRRDVMHTIGADYANAFSIHTGGRGRAMEGSPADLGIVLGDLTDDDPSLHPALVAALDPWMPWLFVPGNHDVDVGATSDADSLDAYGRHFGPDTHAWEEQGATYVLLDDVIVRPDPGTAYIGGFREDQFAFLEAYLPTLSRARLLVVGVHIPLFEAPGRDSFRDADRERLFALLDDFPHVLLLSGHSHAQRHHFHDASTGWHGTTPLHEYNVGAASGAYWSGVEDEAGIPDATMADGTPNGHARFRPARGGNYVLDWRPARVHADDPLINEAMALHAPKVLRQGSWPGQGVHANVYMGQHDTRVEYRIDGGDWRPMQRVLAPDPRVVAENVRDDEAEHLRAIDRAPQAEPSTHLWRGTLPTDLPVGEHRVEVRAFDRWQGERRARTSYQLLPGG